MKRVMGLLELGVGVGRYFTKFLDLALGKSDRLLGVYLLKKKADQKRQEN
jgi:hypothetical protein